jgi:thiamine biosynthesis protein ThiS
MEIILNNRQECFDNEKLTVSELLKLKNFTFKLLVVKINGKLIKRDQYNTATIKSGDAVSVIHLVSGG